MWLKKLKNKKTQFILTALILCFTMVILSGCISFTVETKVFTDESFSCEICPVGFNVLAGKVDGSVVTDDENAMKYISKVETSDARFFDGNMYVDKNQLANDDIIFYQLDDINDLQYNMTIAEGDKKQTAPANGEMWVTTVFAEINEVKVGDVISLGKDSGKEFVVSAIVTTPVCPSGFMDIYPYFLNTEMLETIDGTEMTSFNIYAKDNDITAATVYDNLPQEFNKIPLAVRITKNSMLLCTTILTSIMGAVGIMCALVIFVVALVIVGFIIKSTLSREFKSIGVYKVFGWSAKKIKGFYLKAYLAAGAVGITAGAFLGIPLSYYIGSINTKSLGDFRLSNATLIISLLCAAFFVGVLAVNIFFVLRRIGKITPVQAISMGMASSKEKFNRSLIKNASSPLSMAINDIAKKRGMSIMMMLVLSISFYLCVLFAAVNVTLSDYENDAVHWHNTPAFDCCIALSDNETGDLKSYLNNSEYVDKYVYSIQNADRTGIKSKTSDDIDLTQTHILVYSEINEDVTNTICTSGRIPSNDNEISVSKTFSGATGLGVGDYVEFNTREASCTYLITGVYSTMMQGGNNITISNDNYEKLGLKVNYTFILIYLNDGADFETLSADFNSQNFKSDIMKTFPVLKSEGDTVNSIGEPITIMLIIIFVLFSVLNITNLMLTANNENRRKYGILKAMGFSNKYLCKQNIYKMSILSLVAVAFTIVVHLIVSPLIFSLACGVYYIMQTPLMTTLIVIGMFALVLLTTLMFTIPLRKISPKDLMEE